MLTSDLTNQKVILTSIATIEGPTRKKVQDIQMYTREHN